MTDLRCPTCGQTKPIGQFPNKRSLECRQCYKLTRQAEALNGYGKQPRRAAFHLPPGYVLLRVNLSDDNTILDNGGLPLLRCPVTRRVVGRLTGRRGPRGGVEVALKVG